MSTTTDKKADAGTTKSDVSRTGKGNGSGEGRGAMTSPEQINTAGKTQSDVRVRATVRPTDNGDREELSPASLDTIYTFDSKDKWDADQPAFGDLLAEQRAREQKAAKSAK